MRIHYYKITKKVDRIHQYYILLLAYSTLKLNTLLKPGEKWHSQRLFSDFLRSHSNSSTTHLPPKDFSTPGSAPNSPKCLSPPRLSLTLSLDLGGQFRKPSLSSNRRPPRGSRLFSTTSSSSLPALRSSSPASRSPASPPPSCSGR